METLDYIERPLYLQRIMPHLQKDIMKIGDNFPKMVVSMDDVAGGNYRGVEHVHIEDFLLTR